MKWTIFKRIRFQRISKRIINIRPSRGFTLTEIMVASVLLSIVILVAWTGLLSVLNMSAAAQAKTAHKIELTTALDMMTNEVRHAHAINRSGETVVNGTTVSLSDVVTNAGVNLDDLGNFGNIALYLELPIDSTISACPSGPPDSFDRVVYDIRDSPKAWLEPKTLVRYGRVPGIDGKIDPCSAPIANDVVADALTDRTQESPACSGVLSGDAGFHSCLEGDNVELIFKSAINGAGAKPLSSAITPRTVSFEPTAPTSSGATLEISSAAVVDGEIQLYWTWIIDGEPLTTSEYLSEGYSINKLDQIELISDQRNKISSLVSVQSDDMGIESSIEGSYVAIDNLLETAPSNACFVLHGKTPSGEMVDSCQYCIIIQSP